VKIVTLGQYLRPSEEQVPVAEYITPETFERYRQIALDLGFDYCASGPLVRSSYLADEALSSINAAR
jgi:lipoic acid synthetase